MLRALEDYQKAFENKIGDVLSVFEISYLHFSYDSNSEYFSDENSEVYCHFARLFQGFWYELRSGSIRILCFYTLIAKMHHPKRYVPAGLYGIMIETSC